MWRGGEVISLPIWVIALVGALITGGGVIAAVAVRISKGENALTAAKEARECAERARQEIADYKTHVAGTYVSHAAMAEVERRIMDGVKELGQRIERLFHPSLPGAGGQ